MTFETDLLGDPIPENFGGRGRPPHIPTQENCLKIRVLLAFGWTNKRIASALRITVNTLKKHYLTQLRYRDEARDALKGAHLMMLFRAAEGGNVGAMKELGRMIAADDLKRTVQDIQDGQEKASQARPPKLGKKEQAQLDAEAALTSEGWGDDLQVGSDAIN